MSTKTPKIVFVLAWLIFLVSVVVIITSLPGAIDNALDVRYDPEVNRAEIIDRMRR